MKNTIKISVLVVLFLAVPSGLLTALPRSNNITSTQVDAILLEPTGGPARLIPTEHYKPLSLTSLQKSAKDDRIRLGAEVVNVTVSVTDALGRFVTGLEKAQFEVYDDKVKQQIVHFSDEDAPASIGIVYDVSGSMKERIKRSIRALRTFMETSHGDDDFFLMAFNDRASLVEDFTTSVDRIVNRLMFVNPRGSTALYDAAYMSVEKVQQGRHSKRALLIISDGQDNHSRYTYKELRNRIKEADVQIYGIGITDPGNDSLSGYGRSVLEEITRVTGGRSFFPNAYNEAELVEICSRIALELRRQYSIGFYPTDLASDARWHKVQVKVKPPRGVGRLSLSYKDGYQSFNKK